MSGILALWNLDGQPIDPRLPQRLTDVVAHRGPDGAGLWVHGAVALGHRMLYSTPESLQEKQPFRDETGNLCLTLDGRVDNRTELRSALEEKGLMLRTGTDAELVLRAYDCWGEDCPKHILGDFAFVIWDGRNRRLFCARDHVGAKPFYYYADGHRFLCGSELRQLLEHPAVRREPNEGMVGEYLACSITSQEETLYRGIFRLPPAHTLTVGPDGFQKKQYWNLDLLREIRYRTDDAYAEHFSHLFREAVRCRLRSHGPIGAELSGGLDSSSVVGMAQSLFRESAAPDYGFETFSLVFPGLDCDESIYIDDVRRLWGITSSSVPPDNPHASAMQQIQQHMDFPDYPNYSMFDPLLVAARDRGIRVSLTGLGGDDWLGGGFPPYTDLLREGHWLTLLREIRQDVGDLGFRSIFKQMLAPLLPRRIHHAYAWAFKRNGVPPWIDAGFARRVHLAERLRERPGERPFKSYVQQDRFLLYRSGEQVHSNEMAERSSSRFGIESRHPFNDRRFMEFAIALPQEQRRRGAHMKFVLRQAMRDLLPETVRQRLTKAEFSHTFAQAFESLGGERLFRRLATATWVNSEQTRGLHRQMAHLYSQNDPGYKALTWPLWMIVGIESWFTRIFNPSSSATESSSYRSYLQNHVMTRQSESTL
ncbi:MAG: asparagine synthase (glutamine-hydrolyzing) [Nitrospirae bacterium]|nr:MAG: asparagine synthase (glutamine-hydrolyzing) [Nitrospirota bacterium]